MNCWQRLAIQPTSDLRAIKKAYAVQLKLIDLEIEPKAFIALREALQNAQLEAEYLTQHSMLKKLIDTTKHSIQPTPASQAACGLKFQIEIGALQLPQWIESQSTDLNLRDALHKLINLIEQGEALDQQVHYTKKVENYYREPLQLGSKPRVILMACSYNQSITSIISMMNLLFAPHSIRVMTISLIPDQKESK